eukprot:scaffold6877_cov119-Isochrysis_galbana.AAC.4
MRSRPTQKNIQIWADREGGSLRRAALRQASATTGHMNSFESSLDYIMSTDDEGYHFTVFSKMKEIGTAEVTIEKVQADGKASVHVMHVSGMNDEADPHLQEGAPDPLHRSSGERVPMGSIPLPKGASKDAAKARVDANTVAGLVIHLPRQ